MQKVPYNSSGMADLGKCCAEIWAEGNPLEPSAIHGILQQASHLGERKFALGLDHRQLLGTSDAQSTAILQWLRPGEATGTGPGYFKLTRGREGDVVSADGIKGGFLRFKIYHCHCLKTVPQRAAARQNFRTGRPIGKGFGLLQPRAGLREVELHLSVHAPRLTSLCVRRHAYSMKLSCTILLVPSMTYNCLAAVL